MENVSLADGEPEALGALFHLLRERTGIDFEGYRRATVARRVRNRMMSVGAATLAEYLALVRGSPGEATALLDRLTIKVSRFYRNAAAFDRIRDEALPALAARRAGAPLRLWSAGCGRGEEAYTLAMLLDVAGMAGEILATDIDGQALADARQGIYPEAAAAELPARLRARYLEPVPGKAPRLRVAACLRERVSFRFDDLAAHPGARGAVFDLVCCRNVLIYLARPLQQRTLERIVATLAPGGYLVLGEAEWPSPAVLPALEVVCPRQRLFMARATERVAA